MKNFDKWNELKITLHNKKEKIVIPKEREVYWASIGLNIGIPLSTQSKEGSFFFEFLLNGEKSNALIVQGRLFDTKRLENRNRNDRQRGF